MFQSISFLQVVTIHGFKLTNLCHLKPTIHSQPHLVQLQSKFKRRNLRKKEMHHSRTRNLKATVLEVLLSKRNPSATKNVLSKIKSFRTNKLLRRSCLCKRWLLRMLNSISSSLTVRQLSFIGSFTLRSIVTTSNSLSQSLMSILIVLRHRRMMRYCTTIYKRCQVRDSYLRWTQQATLLLVRKPRNRYK